MNFSFVFYSLIRTLTLSKILSFESTNKNGFSFVFFSLIRIFASRVYKSLVLLNVSTEDEGGEGWEVFSPSGTDGKV